MTRRTLLALGIVAALGLAACSSDGDGVSVDDPWARPTAGGSEVAAFYVVITNDGEEPDRLVSADSPRCGMTQIHLSSMQDGVMSMAEADPRTLVMDPGESLVLEPGGLHVMCMGLEAALEEGGLADVTLTFEVAGDVELSVSIEQR